MGYRSHGIILIVFLTLTAQTAVAENPGCAPWRGEPRPLPTAADPNPERALFARLRAAELRMRVAGLEETNPRIALQVWTHILCLDPADAEAVQQVRELALQVAPELARKLLPPVPPSAPRVDEAAVEEARRRKARAVAEASRARRAAARARALAEQREVQEARARDRGVRARRRFSSELGRAEELFWEARFGEVDIALERARVSLGDVPDDEALGSQRGRLSLLEGRLAAARGESDDAIACFRRALTQFPEITLDVASASRKARRLFGLARRPQPEPRPPGPIDG